MPQMAPMNWLILFLYFSIIFILFNLMNFYSFMYEKETTKSKSKKIQYSWKW